MYYDHLSQGNELWFDWMSDCGDGWDSSYAVARALAQPELIVQVRKKTGGKGALQLPRSKVLFLGLSNLNEHKFCALSSYFNNALGLKFTRKFAPIVVQFVESLLS